MEREVIMGGGGGDPEVLGRRWRRECEKGAGSRKYSLLSHLLCPKGRLGAQLGFEEEKLQWPSRILTRTQTCWAPSSGGTNSDALEAGKLVGQEGEKEKASSPHTP